MQIFANWVLLDEKKRPLFNLASIIEAVNFIFQFFFQMSVILCVKGDKNVIQMRLF